MQLFDCVAPWWQTCHKPDNTSSTTRTRLYFTLFPLIYYKTDICLDAFIDLINENSSWQCTKFTAVTLLTVTALYGAVNETYNHPPPTHR